MMDGDLSRATHDPSYDPIRAAETQAAFDNWKPPAAALSAKVAEPLPSPGRVEAYTAAGLWEMHFPPVSYVIADLLAPGVTLLAGAPKLGKSWLCYDAACRVDSGGVLLGGRKCLRGDVLYAALEDNPRRLKGRLQKVSAHKPGPGLTFWTNMPGLDDGGADCLREWIVKAKNPRLIIIDVLNRVRPSQVRSETPYQYDYRCVQPFKDLADEFNIAIVLVHHTRKMGSDDALERVSGTNGLTGAVDAVWVLARDGQGVTLSGRGRDIEEFELAVEFDPEACRWRVLGDAGVVRLTDERRAIMDALREEGEPLTPNVIATVTGQSGGNVRRLLGKMVRAGEVRKAGYGKYEMVSVSPGNTGNTGNSGEVEQ